MIRLAGETASQVPLNAPAFRRRYYIQITLAKNRLRVIILRKLIFSSTHSQETAVLSHVLA